MLFQPSGMMQFNWLLNAGERPDGSARNYCPQLDGALHGRTVVSEDHVPERPYGRFGLSALIFDPNGDVAAAKSAPSGDSDRARLARQQIEFMPARSCILDAHRNRATVPRVALPRDRGALHGFNSCWPCR